ncbi:MAG TPA: hypothetical protein VIK71_07290 [Flavobacteriales bacterium]
MNDEKFFSQVKNALEHYAPEAPAAVYEGMRKRLWWSNFTRLSLVRLNLWTGLLLLGVIAAVWTYSLSGNASAIAAKPQVIKPVLANPSAGPNNTEELASAESPMNSNTDDETSKSVRKENVTTKIRSTPSILNTTILTEETPEEITGPIIIPDFNATVTDTETESADTDMQMKPIKKRKKLPVEVITDDSLKTELNP